MAAPKGEKKEILKSLKRTKMPPLMLAVKNGHEAAANKIITPLKRSSDSIQPNLISLVDAEASFFLDVISFIEEQIRILDNLIQASQAYNQRDYVKALSGSTKGLDPSALHGRLRISPPKYSFAEREQIITQLQTLTGQAHWQPCDDHGLLAVKFATNDEKLAKQLRDALQPTKALAVKLWKTSDNLFKLHLTAIKLEELLQIKQLEGGPKNPTTSIIGDPIIASLTKGSVGG